MMPGDDEGSLKLSYFDFLDDFDKGEKVGGNDFGDIFGLVRSFN
jgi:hypothetical protein